MARTACISVRPFLLQILLGRDPSRQRGACVVVTEDLPGGTVLDADRLARYGGIRPGMRFAAALSLVPDLRAGTVSPEERLTAEKELVRALTTVSADVEPYPEDAGTFQVGVKGMGRLYPDLRAWGEACRSAVKREGFLCRAAIGWTRAGTYAAARAGGDLTVFTSRREEIAFLEQAPLEEFPLESRDRRQLADLGIETAGAFQNLNPESVRRRFLEPTVRMHAFFRNDRDVPVATAEEPRDCVRTAACPYPIRDTSRLTAFLDTLMEEMLGELQRRGEAVVEMTLNLRLEDGADRTFSIRPARTTADGAFLKHLWRLKLAEGFAITDGSGNHYGNGAGSDSIPGSSRSTVNGVVHCTFTVDSTAVTARQGSLFPRDNRRDVEQVVSAISLLRARFGNAVAGRYQLRQGGVPEDAVIWEPLQELPRCATSSRGARSTRSTVGGAGLSGPVLVRRMLREPEPLFPPQRTASRGMRRERLLRVGRRMGPYLFSGEWWGEDYHREYYYLELEEGTILWVYRDRRDGTWMLQGFVE